MDAHSNYSFTILDTIHGLQKSFKIICIQNITIFTRLLYKSIQGQLDQVLQTTCTYLQVNINKYIWIRLDIAV